MSTPKVSIIVPCYNHAQYLDEALLSVSIQTFQSWECIIVNDGSIDNTEEIAKKWIERDNRFKYLYQENAGLSAARNAGIKTSQGKFILPLDADDKISSEYTQYALSEFKKDPNLKVVYCDAEKFGTESGVLNLEKYSISNLAVRNSIFCTAFFKKDDWKRVGGYDENMIYGLEDWEFWISILKNGGEVFKINKIGFFYRIKENSMVKELTGLRVKEMYEYMSVKHASFFVKHLGSFKHLISVNSDLAEKLKSEKYLLNTLTKRFFGFKFFKLIKE